MSETELQTRLESLESRSMHQEAAIEELTHTLLQQERMVSRQAEALELLESELRSLLAANLNPPIEDGPPPHY